MGKNNQAGGYEIRSENPADIAAAIGDLAAIHPAVFEAMAAHAEFTIEKATPDFIYIIDTGHIHTRTVTNDPEFVIRVLTEEYALGCRKVFYKDAIGNIDELVHAGGHFIKYQTGHAGYNFTE
jgi:hypothetical protein